MTDKYESKAREMLTGTVTSEPAFGELSRRIAAALRSARAEAFEECIAIAQSFPVTRESAGIAAAIRAAKDNQQ